MYIYKCHLTNLGLLVKRHFGVITFHLQIRSDAEGFKAGLLPSPGSNERAWVLAFLAFSLSLYLSFLQKLL